MKDFQAFMWLEMGMLLLTYDGIKQKRDEVSFWAMKHYEAQCHELVFSKSMPAFALVLNSHMTDKQQQMTQFGHATHY